MDSIGVYTNVYKFLCNSRIPANYLRSQKDSLVFDCRRCRAYGNVRAVLFGQKLFAESLYGVASIYMYIYGGVASAYPDNGVFDKKEEACTRKKR